MVAQGLPWSPNGGAAVATVIVPWTLLVGQRRHNSGTREAEASLKLKTNYYNRTCFYGATSGRPLCIHSATTVIRVPPPLSDLWGTDLLGDLCAPVLFMIKTSRRPWRGLNGLCTTLEQPRQTFGLLCAFKGNLASFSVAQRRNKGRRTCIWFSWTKHILCYIEPRCMNSAMCQTVSGLHLHSVGQHNGTITSSSQYTETSNSMIMLMSWRGNVFYITHYDDVIMSTIASQITSLTIVYSTVYSGTDQSKHQSSASLAFVWGIHRGPVNSPHKWPVTRKMFPFDDVIMGTCVRGIHRPSMDSPPTKR